MDTTTALRICAIACLAASPATASAAPKPTPSTGTADGPSLHVPTKRRGGFVWQGFEAQWLARAAGYAMPHRFGSFQSRLVGQNHSPTSTNVTSTATAKFRFTPGVDGDYARPKLHYSAAYSPKVTTSFGKVRFSWTDDVTGDYDNPEKSGNFPKAESSRHKRISIALDGAQRFGAYDNYAVVLRGLRIDMECAAGQPGKSCNSNGIWPHRLFVSIDDCDKSGSKLQCDFDLDIFRSWTPDKGGGKALNDKMKFDVDVLYTVFGGDNGDFSATDTNLVTVDGSIQGSSMDKVRKTGNRVTTGKAGYARATMGVTAFGFELTKTGTAKKRGHLGRYISGLEFSLTDQAYDGAKGKLSWRYELAFWAPTTVHQSDVKYYLRGKLLQLGEDATVGSSIQTPGVGAWAGRVAKGTACFEGAFFKKCDEKGMPKSTSSSESIKLVVPR